MILFQKKILKNENKKKFMMQFGKNIENYNKNLPSNYKGAAYSCGLDLQTTLS